MRYVGPPLGRCGLVYSSSLSPPFSPCFLGPPRAFSICRELYVLFALVLVLLFLFFFSNKKFIGGHKLESGKGSGLTERRQRETLIMKSLRSGRAWERGWRDGRQARPEKGEAGPEEARDGGRRRARPE